MRVSQIRVDSRMQVKRVRTLAQAVAVVRACTCCTVSVFKLLDQSVAFNYDERLDINNNEESTWKVAVFMGE